MKHNKTMSDIKLGTCRGNGGYGLVYFAHDEIDNESIALKFIYKDEFCDFYNGIRELDILCKLNNEFIVECKGVNFSIIEKLNSQQWEDIKLNSYIEEKEIIKLDPLCYEMEIADMNLTELSKQTLSFDTVKIGFLQICLAIYYLHSNNILHGDIKPENVLCFIDKGNILMKLCDFGLSVPMCRYEDGITQLYTCYYRPPEMCVTSEELKSKPFLSSDIWALGCLMYEMFTNEMLFYVKEDLNDKVLDKISEYKNLTFVDIYNKFPEHLRDDQLIRLFSKMTVCDYTKRYTIKDVIEDSFFDDYRHYINKHMSSVEYGSMFDFFIEKYTDSHERELMYTYIENVKDLRIYFSSCTMIDRYLHYKMKHDNDILLSLEIKSYVIVYIFYKYFNLISSMCNFEEILESLNVNNITKDEYKTAFEFERFIITDVCKLDIYNPTLYEYSDFKNSKLSNTDIKKLKLIYRNFPKIIKRKSSIDEIYRKIF